MPMFGYEILWLSPCRLAKNESYHNTMPLQVNSVTVTVTASLSSFVPAGSQKHAGLRQLVYWIHPAGSFPIDGTGVQTSTHAIFFSFLLTARWA